ncbi:M12 family metallo-peptidase [Hymenobacter actinosclerus]|uniref:Metallo-peptidase family M12B Reprolysin-like n=1 Tax=Hymenobacter actinosclerus TaxID=82805 RepID=A0A1I0AMF4_9BACT|nr:M12 family metallo-peptidase [Hymenobacter actinosclerus]SES95518.1 Metallo-peptidase family M12B Reprolysin-like [Hymenobacter actinosclerus]
MKSNSRYLAILLVLVMAQLGVAGALRAQQLPAPSPVALDFAQIRQQLAPPARRSGAPAEPPTYRIVLPTLHGPQAFLLTETFVLPAADAAARQRLRTFVGAAEGAAEQRIALVLTPGQLQAQLRTGSETVALRPATPAGAGRYQLRAEAPAQGPCGVLAPAAEALRPGSFNTQPAPFSFGTQLRRIRMAVLVTQEYYAANGNTDAAVELAVTAALNQMTELYSRELSVSFELVKPTGGSYYFSAVTTPTLPDSDPATPNRLRTQSLEDVGGFIDSRFVASTYDLGHCFHNGGGGVAYVGIVCNNTYKAKAWSGVGKSGFQGILAHEMGHQHGAGHAFNGPCGSASTGSNLEPGGGASIMAYTDVCGSQTLQSVPGDEADHFSLRSLQEMSQKLIGASCLTPTTNTNRPPTISAGPDYVIPPNTPFTLTATGTDPDAGDMVYYTWNQFDYSTNTAALGTIKGTAGLAAIDDPASPLFRPRPPRLANSRTFPDLRYVLANSNRPPNLIGEALSNVERDIHFVVTARDQRAGGGTFATDNVTVTVAPGGEPFALTTQNQDPSLWIIGQMATISWSVAGTDKAPINVGQVRITLSTDGGQTFDRVLAAAVPNTGTASIRVPDAATTRARVRVEAVGNIFFDINDADFPIATCRPVASQVLPATALTAEAGSEALNLTQNGFSLTELIGTSQLKGSISATDPTTNLTTFKTGSCIRYSNVTYYDAYVFVPSVTGAYTIGTPTGFGNMVLRLYSPAGFSASDPCSNRMADNVVDGYLPRSISASLTAGQPYTLVVSNFGGTPDGDSPYSIGFTAPTGGAVYAPLQRLGYDYQYAVVNTASSQVVRLAPTADLRQLPGGTYDVYGLLFQRGFALESLLNQPLSALSTALSSLAPCGQLSTNVRRIVITGDNPLPVTLTDFTARRAGATTLLSWRTASESSMAYFEVERSSDGSTFAALGRVAATNTNSVHNYTFTDPTPGAGLSYYRLLMRELNGKQTYSAVVTVSVVTGTSAASNPAMLHGEAFPNPVPAGARLQLKLQLATAQPAELLVTDMLGRQLLRRSLQLPAGLTRLDLPEARQWQGLCIVQVRTAAGHSWQQKVALE